MQCTTKSRYVHGLGYGLAWFRSKDWLWGRDLAMEHSGDHGKDGGGVEYGLREIWLMLEGARARRWLSRVPTALAEERTGRSMERG